MTQLAVQFWVGLSRFSELSHFLRNAEMSVAVLAFGVLILFPY